MCSETFQAFIALALTSAGAPAEIAIGAAIAGLIKSWRASKSGDDDGLIGDCCEDTQIYLVRNEGMLALDRRSGARHR